MLSLAIWCSFSVTLSSLAFADVQLPAMFGDNMVLQRDIDVPLWGTANPHETVTVKFLDQQVIATTDDKGRWRVRLGPLSVGGPFDMTITGKNTVKFKNVLVGDVWICSGQSNMAWTVRNSANSAQEVATAHYPHIRLLNIQHIVADEPQADITGKWVECGPKTVAGFSGTAYFFGRTLYKKLDIPIGLIHVSRGGSAVEAWMSRKALEAEPTAKPILDRFERAVSEYPEAFKRYQEKLAKRKVRAAKAKAEGRPAPPVIYRPLGPGHWNTPCGLYNGNIAPLIPYAIKGAIWYQGEKNRSRAYQYRQLFPALIQDWRRAWPQEDFPFLFVQLASHGKRRLEPMESQWAELREAQSMTLTLPNTGMATIVDLDEADDLHPKNKQDVGRRLALAAEAIAYHRNVVYSGPIYDSMTVEGNQIRLRFTHLGSGLKAKHSETFLIGFTVAGDDRKFVHADAHIDGNTVVVKSDRVSNPVAVRYAWAGNPACNLYNNEGLPASPFRTDDWPGITAETR